MAHGQPHDRGLPLLPLIVDPDRWLLWLGVLFVLIVYFFPFGIAGRLMRKWAPVSGSQPALSLTKTGANFTVSCRVAWPRSFELRQRPVERGREAIPPRVPGFRC